MAAGEDIELRCDGRLIAGTVFRPTAADTDLGLLFLHGYGSDRRGYLPRAAAAADALGAVTLAIDFGGHGESTGDAVDLSPADHLREVETAFDHLSTLLATDPGEQRIGLCGASYGGYLSALLPTSRPVWRMVLRAPALYPDADFETPRRDTPERHSTSTGDFSRLHQAAASFGGDVLIIESSRDEAIPTDVIDHYVRTFPQAHRRIIEAEHALKTPEQREQFISLILNSFADE